MSPKVTDRAFVAIGATAGKVPAAR